VFHTNVAVMSLFVGKGEKGGKIPRVFTGWKKEEKKKEPTGNKIIWKKLAMCYRGGGNKRGLDRGKITRRQKTAPLPQRNRKTLAKKSVGA